MIDFLTIILLVFGVLQIILFFKIWGMTNNINKIKEELELRPKMDDQLITEAQLKALNGEKDQAFRLYQQASHKNVIEVFNKTINEYGEEDNMDYKERNEYYQLEYNKVGKYFSKRVRKLGLELELDKFNSYDKTYSIICKS